MRRCRTHFKQITITKAEEYLYQWLDEKYGGAPIIEGWTPKDVIQFAEEYYQSQLKPQEVERVLNLCNDIGCNGHVKLRKTCEKCGRSVAFNPLKQ